MTDEAQEAVEFGRFQLLPRRRELRADGVAIALGGRAFDVGGSDAGGALERHERSDQSIADVEAGPVAEICHQ